MPTLLILLLFFPFPVLADARLELHTNTIHAPYNQADADDELELTDGGDNILAVALPNGNYNAQYKTKIKGVLARSVRGVNRTQVDTAGSDKVTTDCTVTQGVYEDKDENVYVTNTCLVRITYSQTARRNRYDATVEVYLHNLAAANATEAAAADLAGAAPQMR